MDVFNIIMDFLFEYSFKPSSELHKEYYESELTRELNTLPSREYLNSKSKYKMSEEAYKLLRKRFESIPLFVFYFNPNIQMQEKVCYGCYVIGFFTEGTKVSANK